jgi:crotonobetainyl-CoA:carnitine CoA-transferase CaiB-like acyl-CoA transferase
MDQRSSTVWPPAGSRGEPQPQSGVKVLEFSALGPGPFCTMVLDDEHLAARGTYASAEGVAGTACTPRLDAVPPSTLSVHVPRAATDWGHGGLGESPAAIT